MYAQDMVTKTEEIPDIGTSGDVTLPEIRKKYTRRKKTNRRRTAERAVWTPLAEERFVDLWSRNIGGFTYQHGNANVVRQIAEALSDNEHKISDKHVRNKIFHFVSKCRLIVESGKETDWIFFERVKKILNDLNREKMRQLAEKRASANATAKEMATDKKQSVPQLLVPLPSGQRKHEQPQLPMSPVSLPDVRAPRRRTLWNESAEERFINLWAHYVIGLSNPQTYDIYEKMSDKLTRNGLRMGVQDVRDKVAELVAKYRRISESGEGRDWMFLAKVGTIVRAAYADVSPPELPQTVGVDSVVVKQEINAMDTEPDMSSGMHYQTGQDQSRAMSVAATQNLDFTTLHAQLEPDMFAPYRNSATMPTSTMPLHTADSLASDALGNLQGQCESMQAALQQPAVQTEGAGAVSHEMLQLEKHKLETLKEIGGDIKRLTNGVMELIKFFKNKA